MLVRSQENRTNILGKFGLLELQRECQGVSRVRRTLSSNDGPRRPWGPRVESASFRKKTNHANDSTGHRQTPASGMKWVIVLVRLQLAL